MERKTDIPMKCVAHACENPIRVRIEFLLGAQEVRCGRQQVAKDRTESGETRDPAVLRRAGAEEFENRLMPVIRPCLNRPVAWDELGDIGSYFAITALVYQLAVATGETECRDNAAAIISRILAAPDWENDPYWMSEQSEEDSESCREMLERFTPQGWYFGFLGDMPELGYWPVPNNDMR